MAGIQGIEGVPKPQGGAGVQGRSKAPAASTVPNADGFDISAQAVQAAAAQRTTATDSQGEIREDRVAEARQRLEAGTHQLQEVVLDLATRLSRFVE